MFNDRRKLPRLADPKLQGRFPVRGLYQALAIASMCIQEQAANRPPIADVVTALSYLANQAYDPSSSPTSSNKSRGDNDERKINTKNDQGGTSGRKWEPERSEKDDSPREIVGLLKKDFNRERAVAEAKLWGENWREKIRANGCKITNANS